MSGRSGAAAAAAATTTTSSIDNIYIHYGRVRDRHCARRLQTFATLRTFTRDVIIGDRRPPTSMKRVRLATGGLKTRVDRLPLAVCVRRRVCNA